MELQTPYCPITITASTGMDFVAGNFIQLTYDVNNFILAQVDSYNPNTGEL